jgi:hypothetical protein
VAESSGKPFGFGLPAEEGIDKNTRGIANAKEYPAAYRSLELSACSQRIVRTSRRCANGTG